MSIGIVGRKLGMSRVFTDEGVSIPVTVIEVTPNRITQVKTPEHDGYRAIQVTTGARRSKLISRPQAGGFAKVSVDAGRGLWEFRLNGDEGSELQPASEVTVELFASGQKVDITGTSKGAGFAGNVKRNNFRTQDATHGNSLAHRASGSIGQNQTPGRVFKGKKMAGQYGNARRTVQNLEVVRIDAKRNVMLVKGAVPGSRGGNVIVRPSVKAKGSV
jgi:large subunit ribosomal protein L3